MHATSPVRPDLGENKEDARLISNKSDAGKATVLLKTSSPSGKKRNTSVWIFFFYNVEIEIS